ncbi:MAG: type I methionyl aminopeptidase [Synergistales bacterium]|nr:type I methionyl aminopeptidase [Synergistales bacterium]
MITLKSEWELDKMRKAGKIVADVIMMLKDLIVPGITTMELDEKVEAFIRHQGAIPSEKGYCVPGIPTPFPASICASINDEVVHGIPSRDRILQTGDIISIDVMACFEGYHGDAAFTYPVGEVSSEKQRLMDVTRESLEKGISKAKSGNTVGDVGHIIENFVASAGFGIVRDYTGHGLGKKLHEPPQVPNFGRPGRGVTLKSGMTIAIEPMVMTGDEKVVTGPDGWVVLTADGSDAAHFEKTVLITDDGVEILTPWE